jgi:hypothetical protein
LRRREVERIKFEHGIELERASDGEYVLRFRIPRVKISPDPTAGHLQQAKKEVLLAVRSLIDRAIKGEEEKSKE